MSFSFQIRTNGPLQIPERTSYVPPDPAHANSISLSGTDVDVIITFMRLAEVVDPLIASSDKRRKCAPDKVPVFKFLTNDGHVVTAGEARLIASRLAARDWFEPKYLAANFPKLDVSR